jgi:hypothetical protein
MVVVMMVMAVAMAVFVAVFVFVVVSVMMAFVSRIVRIPVPFGKADAAPAKRRACSTDSISNPTARPALPGKWGRACGDSMGDSTSNDSVLPIAGGPWTTASATQGPHGKTARGKTTREKTMRTGGKSRMRGTLMRRNFAVQ